MLEEKPRGSKSITITIPSGWVGKIRKSLEEQNFKLEKAVLDISVRPKFGKSKEVFTARFVHLPKKSVLRSKPKEKESILSRG